MNRTIKCKNVDVRLLKKQIKTLAEIESLGHNLTNAERDAFEGVLNMLSERIILLPSKRTVIANDCFKKIRNIKLPNVDVTLLDNQARLLYDIHINSEVLTTKQSDALCQIATMLVKRVILKPQTT